MDTTTAAATDRRSVPVVMISVDGLKPDYVLEAERHGLKLPTLRSMVANGTYATGVTSVLPTLTYPSHVTLITGVSPAVHGIINNEPLDVFQKNHHGWYWYTRDIRVPTLWHAAEAAGLRTATVDWPVSIGAPTDYTIPQFWRAGTRDDLKLLSALSTPGLMDEMRAAVGPYHAGYDYTLDSDRRRAKYTVYLLEEKRPELLTGYFGSLDLEQHNHGPYTPPVFATLEALDGLLGDVLAAARKIGGGEAIFCVVSDHGFFPVEKQVHLNVALKDEGLLSLDKKGALRSWRAYSWSAHGSAAVVLNDADPALRKQVGELLHRLAADPANGIEEVIEGAEAAKRGGFPNAAFVVYARKGFWMHAGWDGALIQPSRKWRGNHGFRADHAGMEASFFLIGPGVAAGRNLGRIDMRDVAPTLAHLLGIELPTAQGKNLLAK
jgi:predicted AlkP superfamily pyrophosphatase or phosphodiesterase